VSWECPDNNNDKILMETFNLSSGPVYLS